MRTRTLIITGTLVALLLAGVVSFYASESPDGLNRVAEDQGISATEKEHAARNSPLAGYDAEGIDNDRFSGGVAGVAGAAIVLVLAGGLAYAVRRRDNHVTDSENRPVRAGEH
ncbi:MAG TPA: PDGLE domain-containing protein [Nocardioidaceae bacterium]|nr:PDGLE domain-containing protein [Nocardioidaceae bacterium]